MPRLGILGMTEIDPAVGGTDAVFGTQTADMDDGVHASIHTHVHARVAHACVLVGGDARGGEAERHASRTGALATGMARQVKVKREYGTGAGEAATRRTIRADGSARAFTSYSQTVGVAITRPRAGRQSSRA